MRPRRRESGRGMQSNGPAHEEKTSHENKLANGNTEYFKVKQQEREMGTFGCEPSLYSQMRLLEYPDFFIIVPSDKGVCQSLSMGRLDGTLQLISEMPETCGEKLLQTITVYGLVGIIKLLAGSYPLVITGREHIGTYYGQPVFRISSMKFLNCSSTLGFLSEEEKKVEAHFVSLLKTMETTPGLFFSYKADLTLSLQRSHQLQEAQKTQPLWKQADPRFLWNYHMLEDLIECKIEPYILPVIQGSFQTLRVLVKDTYLSITLIARRCNRRLGTRMWRRGADLEGHVANFVETEQILETNKCMASHVQVRGSIPLPWEQIVDLTYKPIPKLIDAKETPNVAKRHFRNLAQLYGSILVVNLVNQRGSEEILGLAYANAVQNLVNENIRYIAFDFHQICGQIHFERLSLLYDEIVDDLNQQGCFMVRPNGELQEQAGVVRVNCIDCLDRTNITQSFLGKKVMEGLLQQIGVFEKGETMSQHDYLNKCFRILWVEHGDDISMQYTGTQALKGDFFRHGKLTVVGFLRDGFNALARYYLNNFRDGSKQDAIDLISGDYVVSRYKPSPFQLNGFEAFAYFPLASALIVTGLTLTMSSIWQVGKGAFYFVNSLLWAGFAAAIKVNGRHFCSRPRLCKLF